MEIFYCIKCFKRFELPAPKMTKCLHCGYNYVYWRTSPYKAEYMRYYLPIEVLKQIDDERL
jgi:DNA-directed RNA polymerase subunit RPC12/RpoP